MSQTADLGSSVASWRKCPFLSAGQGTAVVQSGLGLKLGFSVKGNGLSVKSNYHHQPFLLLFQFVQGGECLYFQRLIFQDRYARG